VRDLLIGGAFALPLASLRFAIPPVLAAYALGKLVGQMRGRRDAWTEAAARGRERLP
jgi:hypothetical protein